MKPIPNNILKCMSKADRKPLGKAGRTNAEIEADIEYLLEKDLQKGICNLLRQRGIWFGRSKMNKRSRYTKSAPDFLICWNGKAVGIEAKIGNKEPSEDQLKCHEHMRRDGWLVFVVRTIQEVKDILDGKAQFFSFE